MEKQTSSFMRQYLQNGPSAV